MFWCPTFRVTGAAAGPEYHLPTPCGRRRSWSGPVRRQALKVPAGDFAGYRRAAEEVARGTFAWREGRSRGSVTRSYRCPVSAAACTPG